MSSDDHREETGWSEETSRLFIDYGRFFIPQSEHQMEVVASLLSGLDGRHVILDLCCGEGLLAEVLLALFGFSSPWTRWLGRDASAGTGTTGAFRRLVPVRAL